MPRTVYALLVGINDYPPPWRLSGCGRDVEAVETYLRERVAGKGCELVPRVLKDQEATRQALIDGFRGHLARARAGDVALFYFCGHGSRAPAPPEFWQAAPDRLMETLVCYDSRRGGWDLADKELARLIAEVSRNNPHILDILDCCHSGSGTRGTRHGMATRRLPMQGQTPPPESFLAPSDELVAGRRSRGAADAPSGWDLPGSGRHVLLAACRSHEEAHEDLLGGTSCGVFSYYLRDALQQATGPFTYRDMLTQVAAGVRHQVMEQSPQLEVTDPDDVNAVFLDGAVRPRPRYFTVAHDPDLGWTVDGGSVHGLRPPDGDEKTVFALLPAATDPAELPDLSRAAGHAELVEVRPARSTVKVTGAAGLDPRMTFKAVISRLPLARFTVGAEGEPAGVALLQEALGRACTGPAASLLVRAADPGKVPTFRVLARDGSYLIARPADDRGLAAPRGPYSEDIAERVVRELEHIARWTTIAELPENPGAVGEREVELCLLQNGVQLPAGDVVLTYRGSTKPSVTIRLTNPGGQPRYCALLALSESYAVESIVQEGTRVIRLGSGESVERTIWGGVPDDLYAQGITERKDILKLIVSARDFNAVGLLQGPLARPYERSATRSLSAPRDMLSRLTLRTGLREISNEPGPGEAYDEWCTRTATFVTVRPLAAQAAPPAGKRLPLARGVAVAGHPGFRGEVQLTTVPETTRSLGSTAVPPLLAQDPAVCRALRFSPAWGADPGLSVLEFHAPREDLARVTAQEPLRLYLDERLRRGEHILPVAHDGEFFLPAGRSVAAADGRTEVLLERLPAEDLERLPGARTRGLAGAARILLHKFANPALSVPYPYPVLAAAEVTGKGDVEYEADPARVRARLARPEVRHVLLHVHGLVGDSREMVKGTRLPLLGIPEAEVPLVASRYDLTLTFDYESIHTPITQTALELGQRLRDVGLGAGHGKVLHVVAHGIGGLVARWFIEREGGNRVVTHLVMLGTPNAGSPWPSIHAWGSVALALGLNLLAPMTWPATVLGGLLGAAKAVDVTLDETQRGSDFLKTLAASPDPGVPYTVLAGNTGIIPAALQRLPGAEMPLAQRLLERVLPRPVLHRSADLLVFLGQPNDLAVSVDSAGGLPPDRQRGHELRPAACDHLTYFNSPGGLGALAGTLARLPLA
jgi:hypothetical protein